MDRKVGIYSVFSSFVVENMYGYQIKTINLWLHNYLAYNGNNDTNARVRPARLYGVGY